MSSQLFPASTPQTGRCPAATPGGGSTELLPTVPHKRSTASAVLRAVPSSTLRRRGAGGGVKTHPPEPTGPRRNAPTAGVSEAGWWPRPSFPTKKRGEGKNVARGGGRRRRPRATDPPRPRGVGAPPPPLGSVFPPLRCPAVKRGFGLGGHDRSGCLVFLVSALCSSA